MKKIALLILVFTSILFSSEFVDITLKEYVKIVSKQKNISIIIDDNIDSNYSIYLSSALDEAIYFDILETILRKHNMILKFNKNHYYITKKTIKTSIKNKVFTYKFQYLNDEEIQGLMEIYNYKFKYVKNLKSVFVDCSFKDFNDLVDVFKEYDLLPNQKKLKITILDTNITKVKEYGFDNKLAIKSDSNDSFFFNLLAFPFTASNILPNTQKTSFTSFIKFMNSKNFTKILSSPTISIFDNKKSLFEVVKNIPYETGKTVSNDDITKTTTSIEYKDVGLKLEVTPIINDTNTFIDLSLTIENILDNSKTPITSKRHFKQYVSLNAGEVFVLNGINQTETFNSNSKTPYLSDISFLGWLFKNETEDIKTSNLTILLELN